MKHPYMARGVLPGMAQLVEYMTNKGADNVPNDDYVGPSESTKRLMLQHTPNEQLIETKQINVTVSELPGCVIQELEEYLGEAFDEHELDSDHMHTFHALVIGYHAAWEEIERLLDENKRLKAVNDRFANSAAERIESLESQLQQTREELRRAEEEIDASHKANSVLHSKNVQIKSERDEAANNFAAELVATCNLTKRIETLEEGLSGAEEELAAKNKVLQWYGDTYNHIPPEGDKALIEWDAGTKARSILQSYPPREKGADNEHG